MLGHPMFSDPYEYAEYCTDRMTSIDIILKYRELKDLEASDDVPAYYVMFETVLEYFAESWYL